MTTAYDTAAALISSRKHLLFECEPAEELWNWQLATAQSNAYFAYWSHLAQTSVVKGGIYRQLVGLEEDGTTLTETDSITNVEANASSYYYDPNFYPARDFDGSSDYYLRGAGLTGAADAKTLLFSCWMRKDGSDATNQVFIQGTGSTVHFRFQTNNKILIFTKNSGGTTICSHSSDVTYTASATLLHIIIAIDQASDTIQLYVNDASVATTGAALTDAEIDFTVADWGIGATVGAANPINCVLSELYFTNEYLDISVEANRRKFITAEGLPAGLGNNGETPTGTQPLIYAPDGDASDNRGSGGNFTANGSPTAINLGPRIYTRTSGTVDPDTLDMMAAVFRLHFSTTGKTFSSTVGSAGRDFDGAADYYTDTDGLSGAADGTECIISFWFRLDGGDGSLMYMFSNATGTPEVFVSVRRRSNNKIYVNFTTAAGVNIAAGYGASTYTAGPAWHHFYCSLKTTVADKLNMYVDGVEDFGAFEGSPLFNLNAEVDFTLAQWDLGVFDGGTAGTFFDGVISEFYFNSAEYLDELGYRKFRNVKGEPIPLGDNGELPTGTAPIIYCPDGDLSNNLGTGGNFTAVSDPVAVDGPLKGNNGIYYEKRLLLGTEASVSEKSSDFVVGKARTASGVIQLANHDKLFDIPSAAWSWKNRAARLRHGLDDNTLSDYVTIREMVVDDISFSEQALAINLVEGIDTWLRRFPPTPHLGGTAFGEGVSGTRVPILIGVKTDIIPDLTDNEDAAANAWIYTIADGANQDLDAVADVYAINKSTGARQTLNVAGDYTINLADCTITVNDSFDVGAEIDEVYEIRVDATGQPAATGDTSDDYLKWPGEIAHWVINQFLDIPDSALRLETFSDADDEAAYELAFWIKNATSVREVLRKIGVSVLGDVRTKIDGSIEFFIWTPWEGAADAEDFSDEDFVEFRGDVKIETVYYKTVVRYDEDPAHLGSFEVATATDDASNYLVGNTAQTITVDTFLKDSSAASTLASRINFLYRGINVEMVFEERGIRLMGAEKNTRIRVTKSRAPSTTGVLTDRLMEILELDKDLDAPSVSGRLGDMRGLADVIGKWSVDDDVAAGILNPVYTSATAEQRANTGYWTDANGLADAADQDSKGTSIWW